MNTIGQYGISIYNQFVPVPNKVEDLLVEFTKYFTPKTNTTYERYKFNSRNKKDTENLENYITELLKLASSCNFKDLKKSLIVDRVIMGVNNRDFKKKLLEIKELSLDQVREVGKTSEMINMQLLEISNDKEAVMVDQVTNRREKTQSKDLNNWKRCGRLYEDKRCGA